jgi:hypothetical protein
MTGWTDDELQRVAAAEELAVASLRADGTLRRPRTIWVVRVNDDLVVRSVNGPDAAWYLGTRDQKSGRITAGGVERDVAFVDVEDLDDRVDVAYRTKYARYAAAILDRITSPEARATTIRLIPL